MVLQMLRNIAEKIRPTVIYTILADKTSDVLDREQLALSGSMEVCKHMRILLIYTFYQSQNLDKLL